MDDPVRHGFKTGYAAPSVFHSEIHELSTGLPNQDQPHRAADHLPRFHIFRNARCSCQKRLASPGCPPPQLTSFEWMLLTDPVL
jgi:hypothetical protein